MMTNTKFNIKLRMKGIGLVELIISMLLASLLMAALLSLFLSQRQLGYQIEASTSLSERMSFAGDFFYRHLLEAGFAEPGLSAPYPVGVNGIGTDGQLADTLVIYSEGGHGCTDDELENNAGVEWRRFTLLRDGDRRELRCEDSEGGPYPVLDGVEALQVLYGVDSNHDGAPDFYVNVTQISANTPVVSLRVGLLLRGERSLGGSADMATGPQTLLDASLPADPARGIDVGDGRLRRTVVVTVAMRNRAS
jgi:type IV pilus assembly protein PilW